MVDARAAKIRVAFVRLGGLSAGGTERWLQMMAAALPRERFDVTYFYSVNPPHLGLKKPTVPPDPYRKKFVEDAGVKLVEVKVAAKNADVPTHPWVGTDFWSLFDESQFDIVQTAKSGPAEYPFYMMRLPVVEYVVLGAGVDFGSNIACTIHASQWQRRRWIDEGGKIDSSTVIPIPANMPATNRDMRAELDIPPSALVAGCHQQVSDPIYSPLLLSAFSLIERQGYYFVILGGSDKYRQQAYALGLSNVRFVPHTGNAESISAFLNTLDVFAHGRADGEVFGAVLAEAMMHGKPCVSHTSPIANAQVETIGPAGFVTNDAEAYARAILRLFEDPDLRARLGEAGRHHAREHYSLEHAVQRLANVYVRIAKQGYEGIPDDGKLPVCYGASDLGCLYPGELDDPTSISRHVLTGGVPDAFNVHLFDFFVRKIGIMVDLTENSAIYIPRLLSTGSPDAKAFVAAHLNKFVRDIPKLIELNNWQGRIILLDTGTQTSGPTHIPGGLDCLRFRIGSGEPAQLQRIEDWILQFRPVVCLEVARDQDQNISIIRRLRDRGYVLAEQIPNRFRLRTVSLGRVSAPTTLWCLPRERYERELPSFFDWACRFKRPSRFRPRLKVMKSRLKHEIRVSPFLRTSVAMFRRARSFVSAGQGNQ